MARIKIYSNLEDATIHFDNSPVSPKPLGSAVATAHDSEADRLVIKDRLPKPNGNDRFYFRRLKYTRVENAEGERLSAAPYNYTRDQVLAYLNIEFAKTLSFDTASYRGVWDASTNTPDLTTLVAANGDFLYVNVNGTVGGVDYYVNDVLRYDSAADVWDHIPDMSASVSSIENSALGQYDIHVDPDFVGISSGSNLRPYDSLTEAIAQSSAGDSILVKGENIITSAITLPHGVHIYGAEGAVVKYATYDAANGEVFNFVGTDFSQEITLKNLEISNAGGYGIKAKKPLKVTVEDCTFLNNGWDGQALDTVLDSATTGEYGYDSTALELQAFYAGSHTSNGGAMRVEEAPQVLVIGNTVKNNLRGIRLQDCGINGAGFISRNQSTHNIDSGIYLAAGTQEGCQNVTVINNFSAYNANNGMLCVGGINNKFSQNEVKGNWNAGFCGWGASNVTLRDCGLFDNNRSEFNGVGNTGDARASIQLNESSTFIENEVRLNPDFRFIAEVLDTQVHYTGLGSSTERIGFLVTADMGNLPDNDKNIIKVDDVGFIGQDYCIDLSEVDVTNLRLSLGDNSYQSVGELGVRAPLAGDYYELPFSNHTMDLNYVDFSVDNTGTVTIKEGPSGGRLNPYRVNELQAVAHGADIKVILKDSNKIQFTVPVAGCSIDGYLVNSVLNTALTQLNGVLTNTSGFASGGGNPVTNFQLINDDLTLTLQDGTSYTVDVTTLGVDENKFVSSGALNGSNLELTMNDASVITIDASNMINGSSLPARAEDWYISYGSNAGDVITYASIVAAVENKQPFYNGDFLERGEEYIWTHDNNGTYILGVYSGAEETSDDLEITYNAKWSTNFKFSASNNTVRETSVGVDVGSRYSSGYGITNATLLALSYDRDYHLRLWDITSGDRTLVGESNAPLVGESQTISMGGSNQPNAKFPVMVKRLAEWTVVHDRFDNETAIIDGLERDNVIKSNLSIGPGEKVLFNLNFAGRSQRIGIGYTGPATGENNAHYDIIDALVYGTSEQLYANAAGEWTFNGSNSYHNSTHPTHNSNSNGFWWPASGQNVGLLSFVYNNDNSFDLYDEEDNEVIATKTVDLDGNPIHFHFGVDESTDANMVPHVSKQAITGGSQPITNFAPDVSDQVIEVTEATALNSAITLDAGSDIVNQFGAEGVPAWASLNQATGVFTGTAPAYTGTSDDYVVNCKAANALGGVTSFTVTLRVTEVTYTNTTSLEFDDGVSSYLGGNAGSVTALARTGNGSGASEAWTISLWMKGSTHNAGQTIFYYGHNDVVNNGHIELRQTNHNGLKRLRLRYGTNGNHLQFTTPSGSITPGTWQHVLISYDGGTTGSSSGSMGSYYSRFKIYIDGALQSTSNAHSNYGYTGSVTGQNFRIGRLVSGQYPKDMRINQLVIWSSDQSSNAAGLYNGGATQDISLLARDTGSMDSNYLVPDHYYEVEDSVTTVQDKIGTVHLIGYNFASTDLVTDAP